MPPRVSVLTTIFNREAFLAEAIESVLAQTFADFELILVDDCSTDRSVEIARRYLCDPRVRFFQNERNLGDYPNRNSAAAHATGDYLKYVDSDDTIAQDCLEVMVATMDAHPHAVLGLCHPPGRFPKLPLVLSPLEAYRTHYFDRGILTNAPLSAIIRRSSFEAVGGFSGRNYIGDGELWLRLAAEFPIVLLRGGLTRWRSHGDQQLVYATLSGAQFNEDFHKDLRALRAVHCPLTPADRQAALRAIRARNAYVILSLAARGAVGPAWRHARTMGLRAADFLRAPFWRLRATAPG